MDVIRMNGFIITYDCCVVVCLDQRAEVREARNQDPREEILSDATQSPIVLLALALL